jgi:hypothetical protein
LGISVERPSRPRVVASDTIEQHAISAMLEGIGYYQRRGHAVGRKIVEEI